MSNPLKININKMRKALATVEDGYATIEMVMKQCTDQVDTLIGPTSWQGADAQKFAEEYDTYKEGVYTVSKELKVVAENLSGAVRTYENMISAIESTIAGK